MAFDTNRQIFSISSWSVYKSYLDGTYAALAFFWQEKPNLYRVVTEAYGGLRLETTILKDSGADQVDFEANFKTLPPRTPGSFSIAPIKSEVQLDYDTGAGTQSLSVMGIALPASGGAVAGGTSTNPFRIDPTGTTAQPVTMSAGGYGGQVEGRAADGAAAVGNPVFIGGVDGSTARAVAVDTLGRIITAPAGASGDVTPGLSPGYVATAALTRVAVRSTAYAEQTSNAQRSIVSANAADTAAGTGARTVKITYYTSTFTGPFTETITLNGTTPVNTVATDICYLEKMEVLTVGSGGANAGIISLRTTTGGGGSTFASIAAGDNETFYAHHYVATGVTCYVTGMSVGHNGTVVGSGALFIVRAQSLNTANAVDDQIGDFVRLYGQSSTISRVWGTALEVPGPARISVLVTPESSSSLIYRASMDFYDQ